MNRLEQTHAFWCDETGKHTITGSDSCFRIDGRWNQESRDRAARDYREQYRKHFPQLYFQMRHYVYRGEVRVADCY